MKKQDVKKTNDAGSGRQPQGWKERILRNLKEEGGRVTRQRRILLDIILEEDCFSCKEIYYRAVSRGEKIGLATVYRMVNTLEEIGAIQRNHMYQVVYGEDACPEGGDGEKEPVNDKISQ